MPAGEPRLGVALRAHELDLGPRGVQQPDRPGVGAEGRHRLLEQDLERPLAGDLLRERGGERLQARGERERAVAIGDVAGDHRGARRPRRPYRGSARRTARPRSADRPWSLARSRSGRRARRRACGRGSAAPRPRGARDQDRDRLADRLLLGVAVDPLGAGVPARDHPRRVLAQDRVVGGLDDGRELLEREKLSGARGGLAGALAAARCDRLDRRVLGLAKVGTGRRPRTGRAGGAPATGAEDATRPVASSLAAASSARSPLESMNGTPSRSRTTPSAPAARACSAARARRRVSRSTSPSTRTIATPRRPVGRDCRPWAEASSSLRPRARRSSTRWARRRRNRSERRRRAW